MNERTIQLALFQHLRSTCVCAAPNYTPDGWWECDVWAVTRAGYGIEYEIKLSVHDFRADKQKAKRRWNGEQYISIHKHDQYANAFSVQNAMKANPHVAAQFIRAAVACGV